ncbi:MAG: hypothetical protein K2W82_05665 [Candidatus Obscuribacterales bacterium]|nr:hypothetical protein [Candidatus Obscuribacterales bacterium]
MGAGTGIIFLDFIVRPFLRIGMKFPTVMLVMLAIVYGYIAYLAIKSAYLSEANS